ncbi:MAG: response regulator, partial [Elusimicrobia bacterium]|nr:response regulator [Elusimicrobiota bacterium]
MPYYLYDGKNTLGPFEPADLAKRTGFGATTLVFPAGATTADAWKPAASFPDIAAALAPAPPPPPPPAPLPPGPARSEITLTMPPPRVVEPDPPPAPKPAPAAPAPVAAPGAVPALASPGDKLVLVVDDDDGVRSLIEMTAMTQGFKVVTAINGHDATAKLALKPADLIVTDLMMPGQGGYEFLREL